MSNQDYSLNKLAEDTGISKNTIRPIKNNTMPNPTLNTLRLIADALNCNLSDLVSDDSWIPLYNELLEDRKDVPLFNNKQYFSIENIDVIKKSLFSIGIVAEIQPTFTSLTSLAIKSKDDVGIAFVDIYLRINKSDKVYLEVIDFYVYVNLNVTSEDTIKELLVSMIEKYAKLNKVEQISFFNIDDTKTSDTINLKQESNIFQPTFHCDSRVETRILKEKGYHAHRPLPLPGNFSTQWFKEL